jgi:ABC-type amino acid transport substrate-binding protein
MSSAIRLLICCLMLPLCLLADRAWAEPSTLRVAVLENSPPMSYRDASGKLTGFSAEIIRAVCEEMNARCEFQVSTLDRVIESLVQDEIDIAAVSLLDTPERRSKILFAKPYFRSISLWFASPGILPGHPNIRVAAVKGSAQERYAVQQNWLIVGVPTNGQLLEPLLAGVAQAAIMPMSTAFNLQKDKSFQQLKLESTVLQVPELSGYASFGVNPRKLELKQSIDNALERIKRNGVYDRINTQFLPFRIN